MKIEPFYDEPTSTVSYLVYDEAARSGVVIDPLRDFSANSGRTSWASCEHIASRIRELRLELHYVLDTHAHADHLSGMPFFRERFGARTAIGARICDVQRVFRDVFHLGSDLPVDGSQFDVLLADGDVLEAGGLRIEALHTPGHTPACLTYRVGDALFVGDTLFMPDYGSARCDFPGGSAAQLWSSIQRLYAFPDAARVLVCHDYRPGGRPWACESTVGEQKRKNVQAHAGVSQASYVAFRTGRDAQLDLPALIIPSIQVNIRAGRLPEPESNGVAYLKVPLDAL